MSLREQFVKEPTVAQPDTGMRAASDDLAAALRISPEAIWRTPANANTRPGRLQPFLKRTLDLAIAVPALVLCAPLLFIVALVIRVSSGGPVLFRQTRLGCGGKPFSIFKFRTMTVMEDGDTVVQAKENDVRVTACGKWLRRFSLDELPQLLNVIAGDMSLVGPRPHARAHDLHYAQLIENYTLRQTVKPGITGWAQVNGFRGETPTLGAMHARVDFDVWYAKNAGLALDFVILLRTPFALLFGENAY